MSEAAPYNFVIVGGGTAGWLAALMLQEAIAKRNMNAIVTVVESSRIPVIGVGEGSTAVFRQMLKHFGFDEFEFLRETEATIKFGIRHKDWRRKGHSYDGPIDDPHLVMEPPGTRPQSYIDIFSCAAGRRLADTHLFAYLLDQQKAPFARKADGGLVPLGPFHHAYHFDQALVGKYLRRKSSSVEMIDAEVSGARRDPASGNITALITDVGEVAGDFFIDCTGFRRSLISKVMGGKWKSFKEHLPVNRAMPFWLEHEEGAEFTPFTTAWAQGAGWMWMIPTQARMGCGYVYSDAFITPEEAKAEIEATLGRSIEPRNDLKFDIGRQETPWIGNCLALGLASSFLEPLEATSIHGTIVQLLVFTTFHMKDGVDFNAKDRDAYNAFAGRQVDDFRDFINLHYVSERRDTPFWEHVASDFRSPATRERLALWQRKMPGHEDFTPLPGHFAHTEQQLYYPVLDGLGLLNRPLAQQFMDANPTLRAKAKAAADSLTAEYRAAAPRAMGHREFLKSL
ncbi:MAG: tryptophan 7-halogenase [Alphaproteobacteria bacterium]|nr:tryptophan 7-halogenase [Alphaproteobacteria bacterium]